MFSVVLNGVEEDEEELLLEANNAFRASTQSFQDNVRRNTVCLVSPNFERSNSRPVSYPTNQSNEILIDFRNELRDRFDSLPSSSSRTVVHEQNNLTNNDYKYQRFRPIHIAEHDLTSSDQQNSWRTPKRCNYQVLKSKPRLTFPIFFFVGLYITFLVLSSFIFTMFEQRIVNTCPDKYKQLQELLMRDLTRDQYEVIHNFVEQSLQMQKSGVDVMAILNGNKKKLENASAFDFKARSLSNSSELDIAQANQIISSSGLLSKASPMLSVHRAYAYWDFQQALFYVVSIATTIGYGNLTTQSDYGKIYTIIFGLISIPYTTILISIIVSKFSNGPLRRFKLSLLANHFKEKSHESLKIIRFICLILATIFIFLLIMVPVAFYFQRMERKWTYIDSFYFVFISITTTGLGDYVPEFFGQFHRWVYELVVIMFLYIGIIMIMLWLTLIKSVFRKSISIKLDEYDGNEEECHETVLEEQVLINYHYHQTNYINYGSFGHHDEIEPQIT